MPALAIDKCIAGASVLTDIVLDKFMYHLPFYRVIQKYKEGGVVLNDSTMNGWFAATCERLKPLYDKLKCEVLSSEYIQVDESTIPVIDNEKTSGNKRLYVVHQKRITRVGVLYYDLGSRSKSATRKLLSGYKGSMQTDGYNVYDDFEAMEGITIYACWAHARRKFIEVLDEDNVKATQASVYINKLYHVENTSKEL